MTSPLRLRSVLLATLAAAALLGAKPGGGGAEGSGQLAFLAPHFDQLSAPGSIEVVLRVSPGKELADFRLTLDDVAVDTSGFQRDKKTLRGTLTGVGEGVHRLVAEAGLTNARASSRSRALPKPVRAATRFEMVELQRPEECEFLNDVECLLPYPSSRFLEPAPTPTGFRLSFPDDALPAQFGIPLSPAPYRVLDGFSPTAQVMMSFPGGVGVEASNAPRLLPSTRSTDLRSLDKDSPTVLLDLDTGERILHWTEVDARAEDLDRQVFFLRPGRSLEPGHRYAVAVRRLKHEDGSAIEPEPAFAALRDGRPTTIPAIEARRPAMEQLFRSLRRAGVPRDDLLLAFDFRVMSELTLSGQMLSMRDQAFAFLAARDPRKGLHVTRIVENDCKEPGTLIWRKVRGTYDVPLFLTEDPIEEPATVGFLNVDASGKPVPNGITRPPFDIAIPCSVLENGGTPAYPIVLGHGLFGNGRGMVDAVAGLVGDFDGYIFGATDWRGLSSPDVNPLLESFVVKGVLLQLNNFAALPDRLRQGQLNTLVLARLMRSGALNVDPAFQTPEGVGVFDTRDGFYFGVSLGGIMGLMFNALSPDVSAANIDVGSINFWLLLQRATPFIRFQDLLQISGLDEPMTTALTLAIGHELWVRGESAAYATHITRNPYPGTNAKKILMTEAFLDQQVSNQGTEIAVRTLGIPQLRGSFLPGKPGIPDRAGPLDSAYVVYETRSFDLANPDHQPFIPPLANLQAEPNRCDPHGGLRLSIPASLSQLFSFLQPGGQVINFCNGLCDGAEPLELPGGEAVPCDPLAED